MNTQIATDSQVFQNVEKAIRIVLNPQDQDIAPTTMLINDLGAESIDFLDLSCELEKLLDVQIDFRKLFQAVRAKTQHQALDLSVQDIVDHLKAQLG